MKYRTSPPSLRLFFCLLFTVVLFAVPLMGATPGAPQASVPPSGPKIWLNDAQTLTVNPVGAADAMSPLVSGQAQPLSMISADVDGDGIGDLLAGYSTPNGGTVTVYRGNLDAFAPQSDASFQAIGRGEFPSPFLPDAQVLAVPVRPDFLATGDFTGKGSVDLAVASRGGSTLYIFAGDGKGGFTPSSTITLPGGVTALAADQFGSLPLALLVAVSNGKQSFIGVYASGPQGLAPVAAVPVSAPATNILFGLFGESGQDAAFLSGGKVWILRPSTMNAVPVPAPGTVSAFALGFFIFDRNGGSQIAALGPDGTIQIVARNEFDPRAYSPEEFRAIRSARLAGQRPTLIPLPSFPGNGWKVVESFPAAGSLAAGQTPVFFRTRISSNGADDIMWLGAGNGQMVVISHPDSQPGASTFVPGQVSVKPYNGSPITGAPVRVNIDGRPGIVALHQGQTAPSVSMPLPDPTFFPNRFDDIPPRGTGVTCLNTTGVDSSNDCTLREAIIKANATAGTDNIQLQAGTYTLTQGRAATPNYDAQTGTLNITDSVNITGAGQNSTIITWGTPTTTVDMVMAVNEDITSPTVPTTTTATVTLQSLTIQNGVNHGTHGNDGDGGCMEFDTGTNGTAVLTLTSVTLQNCSTTQGSGGGLANFNSIVATGTGQAIINGGSIIQNNSVADNSGGSSTAAGGGIMVFDPSRITMTGSTVKNNSAVQHTATTGIGFGGGLYIFSGGTPGETPQTQIHSSTISGNQSAFQGGGIFDVANLLIDQGTVISGNKNGQNGAGTTNGGGLFVNPLSALSATLTKVTITGNTSTGTGGGIAAGAVGAGSVSITFSRLAGNTAGATGSNLENLGSAVTATNDWWGTNNPASTIHTTAGTSTFDPFIVLTHTGSPQKIRINQSSTLTGDMSADNHGTAVGLSNLTEIIGLPITFNNPTLGSIPQAQPETLNASAQATATFNAGGTSGLGSADATVDAAVVPVNSNLIASATESGTTATITTVGAHGFSTGEFVSISGVSVSGYNGNFFTILSTPTVTTFTYTAGTSGLGAGSGGTANAGIVILEPPSIAKSFNPLTVAENAPSTITFSITNNNVVPINASFTDTLPANLVVAATPSVVNNCGGSVTAVAGSGSISFTNASSLAAGTCTVQVNVSSAIDNVYSNSVTIDSTDAGNGNTASASLTVINPPSIAKAFGAATIPLNGTTSLTFTLSSTNTNLTLNGVAFTDNLPAGLVVATPPNLSNTCGGTATAVAGSGSVSLTGVSLAPGTSCTVSADIQGTTAGVKNNSVQATSTNGGTGNTSNASITVVAPPVIIKAFGAASIPLNGSTSLTFTIQNNNTTTALTGVAFSDTLPAGLVVATPNGLTGSCGSGTITATQATSVISLSGGTIAASSSCTFSVNVTGTAAGTQSNTTGNVTSTEGGTGGTASASINVVAPPSIAKVFNPSTIALNATTSLTFTITNPAANAVSLTGVAFTDTLPTGLTVANASATVCGGTLTTTAPTGISLSGATIAVNSQCQFSVTVTGASVGNYTNTTGSVSSTNGGTGNTASANLTVASPPSITKAFGAASIPLNGTTSLTFSISNPNTGVALSGVAFTDNLPAGLVVAPTPGVSNTCGGTVTATAGASSVSLSGGTVASNASCAVSVNVQGTTAGVKNNSVQVTSTEGGTGNTSNASITVVGPPVIIKAFGAASIPLNGSTSLSFTIQNNNSTTSLTGIGFSDTLPAGLVVSTPNGLAGSCGGGTITATAGSNTISLSGASLAASSSCTFSVNVTGTAAGTQNNTTGNVSSTEGGTGGTASASINVVAPPSIAKVFNPSGIALNATTSLTFTITNPAANAVSLTGVAFTDTLPTGLTVANATVTACGGTLTTTAPTGIALSGATIAVNSQCQFSVTVTGAAAGNYTNTTGNVSSTNGGTGNTASANLTVASPPSITKAFGAASIPLNGTTSLTFNITNPNTNVALTGVAFTDNFPAGIVVAPTPNASNTCGGTVTATAGAGSVSLSAGTLASSASCAVSVNVQGTTAGVKNNSVQVTSTNAGAGNTANASITVVGPPVIIKAFGAASIPLNGSTSLSFTIQNNNTTTTLTGIGFSDTLPSGLVVSTPNGLAGSCGGGTITATAGSNAISLSGASLAASTSCTFSVNVTGTAAGAQNNTTGNVTSTEGGTGGTASASLPVVAPPSIAKVFNPATIAPNGVSTLTLTITNPAANTVAEAGVAFTDNLPAGVLVATPNGLSNSCVGTATATAGSGTISLTGGSIAVNSNCAVSVNVTGATPGSYTNTTGAVSSTNGGTGNTATATLGIKNAALSITKTHQGTFHRGQTGAQYTITVSNSASAGPTVGTVTVVDTLPNIVNPPVATNISGSGWTCTLGTLTCTRSDVLAPGSSYPAIALTVNIPSNIQNSFTNQATVSGGGDPNSHTASDPVTLGPPIQITSTDSGTATVAGGNAAVFNFSVDATAVNPPPTVVSFTCSGQPAGSACLFNPLAEGQGLTQLTLTVTTLGHNSMLAPPRGKRGRPLYASLLFPVFGLLAIGLRGVRTRLSWPRLGWVLVGLAVLLGLAGCGGVPRGIPTTTTAGTFTITVTGTASTASGTAQGSATVTLTVQ